MKVGKFTVRWTYDTDFIVQHGKNAEGAKLPVQKERDITTCTIFDDSVKEGENPVVCTGSIARMWSDPYCKDTARKISMDTALMFSPFEKEERAEFWEAYRTQTGTPRWNAKKKEDEEEE
jgi:hypothetical protein